MTPKNIIEETEAVSPEPLPLGGTSCSAWFGDVLVAIFRDTAGKNAINIQMLNQNTVRMPCRWNPSDKELEVLESMITAYRKRP